MSSFMHFQRTVYSTHRRTEGGGRIPSIRIPPKRSVGTKIGVNCLITDLNQKKKKEARTDVSVKTFTLKSEEEIATQLDTHTRPVPLLLQSLKRSV